MKKGGVHTKRLVLAGLFALALAALLTAPALGETPVLQTQPYIPEELLEKKIFGEDDRVTVEDVRQYPYSAIAYLFVETDCGCSSSGTGFMVDRDIMMTAAHCVICTDHGGRAKEITAYFGYKSTKNYLYKYDGETNCWAGTSFRKSDGTYGYTWPSTDDDYACLQLNKDVGLKTGWFGLSPRSDEELLQYEYEVAGYRDGKLKYDRGEVEIWDDKILRYRMDTMPGYSGCPVFDWDYYVVGINISHNNKGNNARRITGDLMNDMRKDINLGGR